MLLRTGQFRLNEKTFPKKVHHLHLWPKMEQVLAGLEQVFMDGTERDIQRPGGSEEQREYYNGKKGT